MNSLDYLSNPDLNADLGGSLDELAVVATFSGHPPCPEAPEIVF